MQRTGAVLNSVGPSAPGVWLVSVDGIPRPGHFLEVWYYLHLLWERGREGIVFFRLLGYITLLPGAFKTAVLCTLTILHSLKVLKYQYSLFNTISRAMHVSDTHVQVISCSQDADVCPINCAFARICSPGLNAVVDWGSDA